MSVTDEIKSRIDIVSYVQRFVPTLKKAGRNHKACCPFHSEKTPSFVVNPERQTWHCFGACAEGGDLFTFAQKANSWDFKEALRELAQEAGVETRQQSPEQKTRKDHLERLRGIVASAADIYHKHLFLRESGKTLEYVRETRGLTLETVERFQIGVAPDRWDFALRALAGLGYSEDEIIEVGLAARNEKGNVYDRFRNRLMIPIADERGRVVGFGGRALDTNENAKYINSPQTSLFDKSKLLYGLDLAKGSIRETGTAVIVEGYMDVMQAHQAGYLNVVAQMGTAMTEPQIRRIAPRYANKVVMALDADAAGQSATRRSLEVARQALAEDYFGKLSVDVRILQIPAGKDPDDLLRQSPQRWPDLVASAVSVADFVIESEASGIQVDASMQDRQRIANEILPILLASENNPYQQENIQKLARRLRISERDLMAWTRTQAADLRGANAAFSQMRRARPVASEHTVLPPEYWDNETEDIPPDVAGEGRPPADVAGQQPRAIEPYCLSLLLKNPNLLFQVNRKLRELALNDSELMNGPLQDLSVDDFTQSQYRILMAYLQEAMAQDDMEPLDYVSTVIDGELLAEYRALLSEGPQTVSMRMQGAFQVDLSDIFEQRRTRGAGANEQRNGLVSRALQLRLQRLDQERIEMQYLQEEAKTDADNDLQHSERLSQRIMLSMAAKARLDLEVS